MTAPLSAERLQRAYRQMKTIREFEERLHVEIAHGRDSGLHAPLCGPGSRRGRRLRAPRRRRLHRLHASRPRPLHRQGLRRPGHDERDLRARRRPLQGQGRLDAHRRRRPRACSAPTASSAAARRSRWARRSPAATAATAASRRLRRRRRLQPGHRVRGHEHGGGAEGAGDLRRSRTTATASTPASDYAVGCEGHRRPRTRLRHARRALRRRRFLRRLRGGGRG